MVRSRVFYWLISLTLFACSLAWAEPRRKVIINEDASGPGGSNMQTLLLLIQSPAVEVLGITIVTGDQWRDEELAHTLRLLELIGRTDIPVMSGAGAPLIRNRQETKIWEGLYGKVSYKGAWDERWWHESSFVPPLPEGQPATKPSDENAVNFLVRMVHKFPNQVTIYEGGPMTNLALAVSMDPQFAGLARELVFMGGSLNPDTDYPEFAENPRHEFNFWFDPEAAEIVLRAPWNRIVCTPTDVSIKARLSPQLVKRIGQSQNAAAQYVQRFYLPGIGNDFMWDELAAAAWMDPTIITKKKVRYISVDLSRGPAYGDTLTSEATFPSKPLAKPVEIQLDLDKEKFYEMFARLIQAPTPRPH